MKDHKADNNDAYVVEQLFKHPSLKNIKLAAILGSSRLKEGSEAYTLASTFAKTLAKNGYGIITGAGPGIMDSANRAAQEAGTPSVGIDLVSHWKPHPQDYLDHYIKLESLSNRKGSILKHSKIILCLPGGIGTLGELFYFIDEIYSKKSEPKDIYLVDSKFWAPIVNSIQQAAVNSYKTIKTEELSYIKIIDSIEDLVLVD